MTRIDNTNSADYDDLARRVGLLESAATAGYTSVTRGSFRVAGEEGLVVEGSALVTGLLRVIGRVLVQGLGILEVSSLIDLTGMLRVLGDIVVPAGGSITIGDIVIENGKIYVGGGDIVIDGTTGRINAGGMTIDPDTDGGAITFSGARRVSAGGGAIGLLNGLNGVTVTSSGVNVLGDLSVPWSGVQFSGLPSGTVGDITHWVGVDGSGNLIRIPKSSGGPE